MRHSAKQPKELGDVEPGAATPIQATTIANARKSEAGIALHPNFGVSTEMNENQGQTPDMSQLYIVALILLRVFSSCVAEYQRC